jgi:hypothetical protein
VTDETDERGRRVPTYDEFKRGLRAGRLTDADVEVLAVFLCAPGHARSATELAADLGSTSGHEYGNLRIGTLGSNLSEAMSFTPNQRSRDGSPMYWNVVASGQEDSGQFVYTMHPDLIAALRQFPTSTTARPMLSHTPKDDLPELTAEQRDRIERRRRR